MMTRWRWVGLTIVAIWILWSRGNYEPTGRWMFEEAHESRSACQQSMQEWLDLWKSLVSSMKRSGSDDGSFIGNKGVVIKRRGQKDHTVVQYVCLPETVDPR